VSERRSMSGIVVISPSRLMILFAPALGKPVSFFRAVYSRPLYHIGRIRRGEVSGAKPCR
jgi:hypothetical protein